jgi:hypothetical protein
MPVLAVRLKIRVRLFNGSRAYVDPVYSSNGKLKPLYALVDGKPEHHPEGVYNLRYLKAGKRVWDAVGADPQLALTAKLRVEHSIHPRPGRSHRGICSSAASLCLDPSAGVGGGY